MAWISIHEQVMGGKLRNLAKAIGCSQNEALGILVRLWLWGINNAKKDGEIIGADKEDIADVLTVGLEKKILPKKVVDALIETNWIDYKGNYYIHDWSEWQGQWYKALESREKATERKRKERARKENEQLAPEIETKEKPYDENLGVEVESQKAETSTKSESKEKIYNDYPSGFETFWQAYPRKTGKGEAYKKYKARLNDGWSEEQLLEAARVYAEKTQREHTDPVYIKHAKTFLSDSTPFIDFLPGGAEAGIQNSVENQQGKSLDDLFREWSS